MEGLDLLGRAALKFAYSTGWTLRAGFSVELYIYIYLFIYLFIHVADLDR